MLTGSVTLQRFKPISGWSREVGQRHGRVKHGKLSPRDGSQDRGKPFRDSTLEQLLEPAVPEASNYHGRPSLYHDMIQMANVSMSVLPDRATLWLVVP